MIADEKKPQEIADAVWHGIVGTFPPRENWLEMKWNNHRYDLNPLCRFGQYSMFDNGNLDYAWWCWENRKGQRWEKDIEEHVLEYEPKKKKFCEACGQEVKT